MKFIVTLAIALLISTSVFANEGPDERYVNFAATNHISKVIKTGKIARYSKEYKPTAAKVSPSQLEAISGAIAKPARYVAGKLICAINVNLALAERGIKGTGSAMAASFRSWGHASVARPGAVAFNWRGGGGHVSIVAKVINGTVYVWNPSPRGQGWQLRVNPYHSEYRVASL